MMRTRKMIVISGPSGAGKNATLDGVLGHFDGHPIPGHKLMRVVTSTTRKPRGEIPDKKVKAEKHGVDYFFLDEAEFEDRVAAGRFIEHIEYSGNRYGTEYSSLDLVFSKGKVPILVIDVAGAKAIRERFPDSLRIFLSPGLFEDLKKRLEGRNNAAARLERAREELKLGKRYCNRYVVNEEGKLEQTVAFVVELIKKYLCQR